jgi:hypothetical protein
MKRKVTGLKRKLLMPLAFSLAVAPALNNGSNLDETYKTEKVQTYLEKKAEKEAFETRNYLDFIGPSPKYRTSGGNCSRYARSVGKDFYGKDYFWADAWDRRHLDEVIYSFSKDENAFEKIKDLEKEGTLNKGMLLGVYHRPPKNSERDIYGRKAKYSHVVIFRGIDKKTGKFYFDHEWGSKQDTISLDFMENKGWKLMDLIDENLKAYAESIKEFDSSDS